MTKKKLLKIIQVAKVGRRFNSARWLHINKGLWVLAHRPFLINRPIIGGRIRRWAKAVYSTLQLAIPGEGANYITSFFGVSNHIIILTGVCLFYVN